MKPYDFIFDILNFRKKSKNGKGKVLRIKKGYNPNSSSIGTIVFTIPMMFLGLFTLLGTLMASFFSILINRKKKDSGGDAS